MYLFIFLWVKNKYLFKNYNLTCNVLQVSKCFVWNPNQLNIASRSVFKGGKLEESMACILGKIGKLLRKNCKVEKQMQFLKNIMLFEKI